jgi:hypothetical protein
MKRVSTFGLFAILGGTCQAAEPNCGQSLVDGTTPPATSAFITPRQPVQPFYQWENNNGYCGEVSMMQAGLAHGQWMSQFNARRICGTGLSQSGPDGACATHDNIANYNAQLLIEDPDTGVSGRRAYANAALCVANSRLAGSTFPYEREKSGIRGYHQYMAWVKQQVILGNQVTLAVLFNGGSDPQYDHEVAVLKIGTNHAVLDPTYYPDDVVYFDDHGAYTLHGAGFTANPAIPPGANRPNGKGCTPYVFGYSFDSLARTRSAANGNTAQAYSIVIPGERLIHTGTGGSGYDTVPIIGPRNYAFSVSGPADTAGENLPVSLTIEGPTKAMGVTNPKDPIAGYNYENPMIGKSVAGRSCTNDAPLPWMTNLVLRATAGGLTPGRGYNLYEYEFARVRGEGMSAALAVPDANFNANAAMATHVTGFTALGAQFIKTVITTSDKIVVFRCVPADGP